MIDLKQLEKQYSRRDLQTAFHEAGHTVFSWYSKYFKPNKVYFTWNGGTTEIANSVQLRKLFSLFTDDIEIEGIKNDMVGFYSEWYFLKIERYSGCEGDKRHAEETIKKLKRKYNTEKWQIEVVEFIKNYKKDIYRIAVSLLIQGKLNYPAIKWIIKNKIILN